MHDIVALKFTVHPTIENRESRLNLEGGRTFMMEASAKNSSLEDSASDESVLTATRTLCFPGTIPSAYPMYTTPNCPCPISVSPVSLQERQSQYGENADRECYIHCAESKHFASCIDSRPTRNGTLCRHRTQNTPNDTPLV